MAGYLVMKEMDLIELYQLLSLYRRTYLENDETIVAGLLEDVGRKYRHVSGGKDIRVAHNPREAGRKRKYTPEQDARIAAIRGAGKSIRETAREAGCSIGHVQDVLRKNRSEKHGCMEINKNTPIYPT